MDRSVKGDPVDVSWTWVWGRGRYLGLNDTVHHVVTLGAPSYKEHKAWKNIGNYNPFFNSS